MKNLKLLTRFTTLPLAAMIAGLCAILPTAQCLAAAEQSFDTPEDAVNALRTAAQTKDHAAMEKIFGPEAKMMRTGDEVQDSEHRAQFAVAIEEGCKQVPEGDNKITLEIGTNNWPFPIPLVKAGSQWHFDTEAGKEEIINRHVGRDELNAIGVCEAYVTAQKQYYSLDSGGNGQPVYALKFKSAPGKKDGLYWETNQGETPSPFSALVAEAHVEGYGSKEGTGHHPFHGYFFKVLTRQGGAAPGGKMNYLHHGQLTKGFALVGYPEKWGQSGVMTFMVNQDGKIYQRNLGEKTREIAASMKEYNPDGNWTLVEDKGMMEKE